MLQAFKTALTSSSLYGGCHNSVHVTQLQGVVQLDADTAVQSQITAAIDGGNGGTVHPSNVSMVLSWLSGAYWRGGKPRTYLPGVATSSTDSNHSLLDSFKTSLQSLASAFRSDVNGITTPAVDLTELGMVSFVSGKAWRSTPAFFPFNSVIVHDRLASQRRRLGPWLQ